MSSEHLILISGVEKLFSNVANCDELTAMFDSKYQETPNSINLLKRIVKVLDKKDCTDAEIYFLAAKQLHEIEPSALSAHNMGNLAIKKNKSIEAITFFKDALKLSETNDDKAKYFYGLSAAYFKSGNKSTARDYALKSLEIRPKFGKSMLLIGDIYAASWTLAAAEGYYYLSLSYFTSQNYFRCLHYLDQEMEKVSYRF